MSGYDFYNSPEWEEIRDMILERDGYKCQAPGCGATDQLTVHHKVPRILGGDESPANLITHCRKHHMSAERKARWWNTGRRTMVVGYGPLPKKEE